MVVFILTTAFFALKYQEDEKFHNLFSFDTFRDTLPQKWQLRQMASCPAVQAGYTTVGLFVSQIKKKS